MSAAATAAGYLYASGRLRGRTKDGAESRKAESEQGAEHRRVKVAALPEAQPHAPQPEEQQPQRAKRTPTVQYRTRRWRPDVP